MADDAQDTYRLREPGTSPLCPKQIGPPYPEP
jgi:hypothetical protein